MLWSHDPINFVRSVDDTVGNIFKGISDVAGVINRGPGPSTEREDGFTGGSPGSPTGSSNSGESDYMPEVMDYDVAMRQARQILSPEYEKAKEETLGNLANEQINRGFYGQAPGDAITQQAIGDLSGQYMGQLANQAQNIRQQDFARNLQQAQHALQRNQFDWEKDFREDQFDWQKEYQGDELELREDEMRYNRDQREADRRRQQQSDFWGTIGGIVSTFLPVFF